MNREAVPATLKGKIWSSLEPLAKDPGSTRAFHLAEAMKDDKEWQRAIPLWLGYIQHAYPTNWEGYKTDAITNLFTAYCRTGQWQTAEKFLFAQLDLFWRVMPDALAEIAVAAAQANATDDAMRLWRKSANIDRRNLDPLAQLAQTKLKPKLVAMYSQMKKEVRCLLSLMPPYESCSRSDVNSIVLNALPLTSFCSWTTPTATTAPPGDGRSAAFCM